MDKSCYFGEDKVGLMPLPEHRKRIYQFYKLSFDEDGNPCKEVDGIRYPHPIFPTYLIQNYAWLYSKTGDSRYLDSALLVLRRAKKNMREHEGGIAYWYNDRTVPTKFTKEFYSGLTQSNYLIAAVNLYKNLPPSWISQKVEISDFACSIFKSILVPREMDGPTVYLDNGGVHIEEYPFPLTLFTLNGWLTAVKNVYEYGQAFADDEAVEFSKKNVSTIESMLSLFDCERLLNTRYQLGGFVYFRIIPRNCSVRLHAVSYQVGGDSFYIKDKLEKDDFSRWDYYFKNYTYNEVINENKSVDMNIVGSYFHKNSNLIFELSFNSCIEKNKSDPSFDIYIAHGDYDPLTASMKTERWDLVDNVSFDKAVVNNRVALRLSRDCFDPVAYPTNFKKVIEGKNYNAYHFIHIKALESINSWYKSDVLEYYILKFKNYVDLWPSSSIYAGKELEFDPI